MAAELNITTHRWYQKRYHIKLPVRDVSKKYIYADGIQKIDAFIDWTNGFGVIASGSWDDSYLWSDVGVWNDSAPFALATGTWNWRGIWADAATWNDGV